MPKNRKLLRRRRVRRSVRSRIHGTAERPRLCVFRSNANIYAQVIDDDAGRTLAAASSLEDSVDGARLDQSKAVGKLVAERAKEQGIEQVIFDRNVYPYHGRVKAVAEGAREGGLAF
ncbi:MAG: 50S ribosomal protein L18 [Bacteroidota bacterium]